MKALASVLTQSVRGPVVLVVASVALLILAGSAPTALAASDTSLTGEWVDGMGTVFSFAATGPDTYTVASGGYCGKDCLLFGSVATRACRVDAVKDNNSLREEQ